jgi:hypothetical protein
MKNRTIAILAALWVVWIGAVVLLVPILSDYF